MKDAPSHPATTAPIAETEYGWTSHPLTQEAPARSVALIAIVVSVSVIAGGSFEHPLYGLASLLLLVGSMSRYLFPTRYTLTDEGVTTNHLLWSARHPWHRFVRFEQGPQGVFLSPFKEASRLDSFRGLYLRCPDNQKCFAFVAARVGERT
ncbi:MAG: hypothetical protein VX733_03575 [Candidatus Latescibacterota bacterium]|nr:hypothetical protein [Candidatus Latescibacterota bacterium]